MPVDFLDSNVLVYMLVAEASKAQRARILLEARPTISVQILNEVALVARRKLNLAWPLVRDFSSRIQGMATVVTLNTSTHDRGLHLAERHKLAVYDAMVVAAALEAGCTTLWSEDMHDGLMVDDRLTIRNPFAPGLA